MKIKEILFTNQAHQLEATILLGFVINQDKSFIYAHPEYELSQVELKRWLIIQNKLQAHIPLAYILKEKEFYGRRFYVDHRVLIPRPETEAIVDQVINQFNNRRQPIAILEIGIGSGALLISIVLELEDRGIKFSQIVGSDVSPKTLTVAKMNLRRYHLQRQIGLIQSDLFESIPKIKFDLIVANLPYLSSAESKQNIYEPQIALAGGVNGGELIQMFTSGVDEYKNPDSITIIEKYNGDIEIL